MLRNGSTAVPFGTQKHAVCITGLQRSYPEISHNIHYFSPTSILAGGPTQDTPCMDTHFTADSSLLSHGTYHAPRKDGWSLERHVGFFGVRPANDSWSTVRTDLPPLLGESIQTPCGLPRAPWFSAYAKTTHQRITYGNSFIQMMCDLKACHTLIQEHERRIGRAFLTIARLRLDLAWETPLVMPAALRPNTVYTSRMNTKAGLNDKWGIGRREATPSLESRRAHTTGKQAAEPSAKSALRATMVKEGLVNYSARPTA